MYIHSNFRFHSSLKNKIKTGRKIFPKKKNQKTSFYATFQYGRCNVFKFFSFFFGHENIKEMPSKVAHNRPKTFFSCTDQVAQTSPELIFHIIKMSQVPSVYWSVHLPTHPPYLIHVVIGRSHITGIWGARLWFEICFSFQKWTFTSVGKSVKSQSSGRTASASCCL